MEEEEGGTGEKRKERVEKGAEEEEKRGEGMKERRAEELLDECRRGEEEEAIIHLYPCPLSNISHNSTRALYAIVNRKPTALSTQSLSQPLLSLKVHTNTHSCSPLYTTVYVYDLQL